MCQLSKEDWLMNIENTAAEAEKKYGAEAVEFVPLSKMELLVYNNFLLY